MAARVDPTAQAAFAETGLVLDALPWAVVVTDANGRVLAWNPEAARLYGRPAGKVLGRPVADVVTTVAGVPGRGEILATTQRGEMWKGEFSIVRPNGEIVRVAMSASPLRDAAGDVVGLVSAADDVTELHLVEQRAADLAEHLRLALEAGELGTWRWDRATGAVTWDTAMERLYGLEPGSFPGTYEAWLELRGQPGGQELAESTLAGAMASGESYAIETEVTWPDGSAHWLHGWGRATFDSDGNPAGAIGCTADITARKTAELEARRRAEEAAERARLERLQRERLTFLAHITDTALAAADHHEFLQRVIQLAVPELADWCTLRFLPEPGAPPELAFAHADPARVAWLEELSRRHPPSSGGATGAGAVLRTGRSEFVPVVDEAYLANAIAGAAMEPGEARAIVEALHLTSIITVPLRSKRGILGVMQLVSAESGRRYTEDDLALAEAAAGRIAETLNNLWLTQQQRTIAEALQKALLPPALPTVPGIDVAVRYWVAGAANEVGGDFYDIFRAGPDRWAVVIGDVCGTGADAAAVTVITRHTIRAAATHGVGHRDVMAWLNDAVLAGQRDRFCTAVFGTLEPRPGGHHELTVVVGGHPLPVLARADGAVHTVGTPGSLIGVFATAKTTAASVLLAPGDTVVLYTDGITDLRPPNGLTVDEVAAIVEGACRDAASADDVAEALRAAIEAIRPIPERGDDIALVVLRVEHPPT
jgi:PAS domain S-box-containing protein